MAGNTFDLLRIAYHYLLTRHLRRWTDRKRLERWQRGKVLKHLQKVRAASAFYRELWADLSLNDWDKFPIVDKQMMMGSFDNLNTAGVSKKAAFAIALEAERTREFTPMIGSVTVGLSSGTSGNRGLFLVSRRERLAWAGTVLGKILPGSLLASHRIAFFLRADSNLYGSVGSRRIQFLFYDLLDPMEQHIERLNGQTPTLLVAPPSMLRMLAELKLEGKLRIRPGRIVSVAEVLDPLDRRRIEEAFGQTVHQVYQCTEGFLAATCPHGTLHLNEDVAYVEKEYVDRNLRKFVPIITDFSRFTQPMVRYRLNDLLTERSEPCPCGSPFTAIEAIEGRCDDLFYFPAAHGDGLIAVFPDFITRAIINASEEVKAYHAILHAPDRLEIGLEAAEEHREAAQTAIVQQLQRLCGRLECQMPQVAFSRYQFTPGMRKLRRVERRFAHDDAGKSPVV